MRDAVDAADAGEAGVVAVLVHVRRVDGECRLRELLGELPRQHHPELGRVLRAADAGDGVVEEPPVDCGEPTGLGVGAAAAADEGVDRGGVDPLVAEHVEDDAAAEVELVVDVRELEELRRVVEEAVLEARGLVLEEADLGRGGPGVDDEDAVHFVVRDSWLVVRGSCYQPMRVGMPAADISALIWAMV